MKQTNPSLLVLLSYNIPFCFFVQAITEHDGMRGGAALVGMNLE